MRGGGDHLPGGKKASAAFVNSTIGTVSWATGEPCVGGGGGQKRWVSGLQGWRRRGMGRPSQPCHSTLRKCLKTLRCDSV